MVRDYDVILIAYTVPLQALKPSLKMCIVVDSPRQQSWFAYRVYCAWTSY